MDRLRSASGRARRALDVYNETAPEATSAAEMPFLIVPVLVEDRYVVDLDEAVETVEEYVSFVEAAVELATLDQPNAASDLLSVLADYGRHWELMVLAEVPLDRPFLLKYQHLDPTPVKGWRSTVAPAVVLSDADSNHVENRIEDPGTRLVDVNGHHPRSGLPA